MGQNYSQTGLCRGQGRKPSGCGRGRPPGSGAIKNNEHRMNGTKDGRITEA